MYIAFSKYNGSPSIRIPVEIVQQSRTIHCKALIDSGATGILMHHRFASQNQLSTHDLARPIPVRNIDGTPNSGGQITQSVTTQLTINTQPTHSEQVRFLLTDLGHEDVILGTDWLRQHNPNIDWTRDNVTFSRCPNTCNPRTLAFAEIDDEVPDIPHEWEIEGISAFRMTLSTEIAQKTT